MYFLPPHIHKTSPTINTLPLQRVHLLQLMGLQDFSLSLSLQFTELGSLWGSIGAGHSEFGQTYKEVYPPLKDYPKSFTALKHLCPSFPFKFWIFTGIKENILNILPNSESWEIHGVHSCLEGREGMLKRGRVCMFPLPSLLLSRRSVMSNSLQSHGLQHARLPCPSLSPGVCSNSCPLSRWCHSTISPLSPPLLLPSILPRIRGFSNELALRIRWPNYWSFSISPSNEYSGLISFRIDWFDLLAVQGSLRSLLQPHNLKASVLSLLYVQLSHLYMTTRKTIVLTTQTFVGRMMSWLLNMLPTFVMAFLPMTSIF